MLLNIRIKTFKVYFRWCFYCPSDLILDQGGGVYGVDLIIALGDAQRADTYEGRNRMRISKYVQSDLGSILKNYTRTWKMEERFCLLELLVKLLGLGLFGWFTYIKNLYM